MNLRAVLEYALAREREGCRFFTERAEQAAHASVRGMFQRLAVEEKAHIAFVEEQIARLGSDAAVVAAPAPAETGFFSARAASEMIEQTTSEAMVPDLPVLRMAWLIERDLSEFYRTAASSSEGAVRDALLKLASWEEGHESFFRALHDRVMSEYAAMPWGG